MTIELYDLAAGDSNIRFSPYCWRIRMALAHKGLDVTTIPVHFMDKEKIAFSGQKLVPVIRDGDNVVHDSWQIALYLDASYPDSPKLFGGTQSRALANFVHHWVQTRINGPVLRMVMMDLFNTIDAGDRDYFRASREKRFGKALEQVQMDAEEGRALLRAELAPLRDMLADQPFLAGEAPAFVDYIVFGTFMWARSVSPVALLETDDAVHTWRERMLDLFDGLARQAPHPSP